ncbi:MAG: hypothetical protein JWO58_1948 [Chitinophagaceae bacterium]|nr:hypothetical protein [Chitinophagaceae bacterium]
MSAHGMIYPKRSYRAQTISYSLYHQLNHDQMIFLSFFIGSVLLSKPLEAETQAPDPKHLLTKMIAQINQTKSLSYTFRKKERIHDGFSTAVQDIKLFIQPLKAHIYVHEPKKGTVVVWAENENNGELQISPGWLPFVKVNLSTESDEVRKDNHHSIEKIGFDFLSLIVHNTLQKHAAHLTDVLHYGGLYKINNRWCHKVIIDFKGYRYSSYTIKPNENLFQIAAKFNVNEYMILLNNPQIKSFKEVKAGQIIQLPNEYAKTTELYIDQENMMPIVQKMYDEKGLFEHYEFINLQYNPPLHDMLLASTSNDN